jgi:hypothetical protein
VKDSDGGKRLIVASDGMVVTGAVGEIADFNFITDSMLIAVTGQCDPATRASSISSNT